MAGEGIANKRRGDRHESAVRNVRPGRRRVPLSGGGSIKGDVQGPYELIQCKSSAQHQRTKYGRGSKEITIHLADLKQMIEEQQLEGKPLSCLNIHYRGESSRYVVMTESQYEEMLDSWIEKYVPWGASNES